MQDTYKVGQAPWETSGDSTSSTLKPSYAVGKAPWEVSAPPIETATPPSTPKTTEQYLSDSFSQRRQNIKETTDAYTSGKIGLPQAFVNNVGQVLGGAFDIPAAFIKTYGQLLPKPSERSGQLDNGGLVGVATNWLTNKLADPLVSTYQNAANMYQHAGDILHQANMTTDPVQKTKLINLGKSIKQTADAIQQKAQDIDTSYQENSKTAESAVNIGTLGLGAGGSADEAAAQAARTAKTATADATSGIGGVASKVKQVISSAYDSTKGFITNRIGGKTAEEILSTPEAQVSKLSPDEQKVWYKDQAQKATQTATQATEKANSASEQSLGNAQKQINDFNQKIGETSRNEAIKLKEPAKTLMRTSSNKYVELSGEAADGSPTLNKSLDSEKLSNAIDSKFEYNPEIGNALKNDLGITETQAKVKIDPETKLPVIEAGKPAIKSLTNQEILDKAREIMQTVSKTAKQGGKTYSFDEYQAIQKYRFLMEQLGENGVDMTKANDFWKSWAPVRDRIVREIKPFDESGVQKVPFTNTINRAASVAKTSMQVASKADAQNFIAELESRLGLKAGSIGSETRQAVEGLEKSKLSKENIIKASDEALKKIKADKVEALKKMSLNQYNTVRQARINGIIKKSLIGLGIYAGAKATGLDKAILGTVKSVI